MTPDVRRPGAADPASPRDLVGALYVADPAAPPSLMAVAREFSPRVTSPAAGEAVLDLSGLTRLFGDTRVMAAELRRTAAAHGLQVRVAMAGSSTAARLLARHRPGTTIVAAGDEARAIEALPLEALLVLAAPGVDEGDPATLVRTLQRWGLRTLGAFVQLPAADVAVRLGQHGVAWQRRARGEDLAPLVPDVAEERFEEAVDLEWPIEGLEPLSFVLGRLLDPLSLRLERRDRGAAAVHVHLHLVTRAVHSRSLELPTPIREARALRTLLLLDLESHPPAAGIDRVVVAIDPTPGRVVQYSLLTRPLPTPEHLSTLMARLQALMGDSRCGAPALVASWAPGAFTMAPFAPREMHDRAARPAPRTPAPSALGPGMALKPEAWALRPPVVALRRFRSPIVARVQVEDGRPVRVIVDRRGFIGGRVEACAGPWRTSGGWWTADATRCPALRGTGRQPGSANDSATRSTELQLGAGRVADAPRGSSRGADAPHDEPRRDPCRRSGGWDRDEWDVMVAGGTTYRLFRDRERGTWFVEGMVD